MQIERVLVVDDDPLTREFPAAAPPRPKGNSTGNGVKGKDAMEYDINHVNVLSEVERRVILRTLRLTNGNRTKAARILGISVRTLYTKIRKYRSAERENLKRQEGHA